MVNKKFLLKARNTNSKKKIVHHQKSSSQNNLKFKVKNIKIKQTKLEQKINYNIKKIKNIKVKLKKGKKK